MSFWEAHGTKVLGAIQLGVGFAVSSVSMLQGQLPSDDYVWLCFFLGVLNSALGGATIKRGFTNSDQEHRP